MGTLFVVDDVDAVQADTLSCSVFALDLFAFVDMN
jgi:hypothetical protein